MPRSETLIMEGWEFTSTGNGDRSIQRIDLPHDWAISAPFNEGMEQGAAQGYRDRWGTGEYRRTWTLPQKEDGYRYYLDFGGIYENSAVYVNGSHAGGQKYGYTPFRLDVTDQVVVGENEIRITVDNTQRPVDRWYSGAGVYRPVKWLALEEPHLDERDVIVRTSLAGGNAEVTVETGTDMPVTGCLSNGAERQEASGEGLLRFHLPNPLLWSAESPHLYTLDLQLTASGRVTDEIRLRIGIRSVEFIPSKGMLVNGQSVKLRGVCVHQDVSGLGVASTKALWRERLLLLKDMGCNAIRPSHHMFSQDFLDLCDEIGFYVYEECFDKWTGGLYGRYFEAEWRKDVEAMVKRDRNRPSVVIWGVGNEVENQAQNSMLGILRMLREHVRTFDTSRPVTYAMNPHFKRESNIDASKVQDIQKLVDEVDDTEIYDKHERVERIKSIADIVDLISCNYQEQWYPLIHEAVPDKLILGTEVYQYFMGHEDQMQNFTVRNPSLVPERLDYVIGGMIWTGFDYLGESMGYPAKGWGGAVIQTNNVKKAGYHIIQSYWSDKPVVHFSVMDYTLPDQGVKEQWDLPPYVAHWHFPQFIKAVIPYMIASNCDEVAL